jgi:hypothetical protein
MKYASLVMLTLLALVPLIGRSQASVKEMVESKRYVFEAQSMSPLKGSMRTLTPGYTLKVSPDTVVADLPYAGRAYQAPYGGTDGGIKFEATNFEYATKEKKKGWTINIKTSGISGSPKVIIDVFDNGNARVVVYSTDRESITFNGIIKGG